MALIASREERPLGAAELLACVTDATGRIRAANAAFVARHGHAAGEPLEALRHPDLPRRAVAPPAYVRALARDGTSYWAMALATPVADGYLVVGFRPTTPLFDTAREIYEATRAAEPGLVAASHATTADANGGLKVTGYEDWKAFGRTALVAEAAAADRARGIAGATPLAEAVRAMVGLVARMRARLARHRTLPASGFVDELAEEIRLFAVNAILAAHRLADGEAIGAVAGLMKTRSDAAGPEILALGRELQRGSVALEQASFLAAAAKVEVELLTASLDADPAWLALLADAVARTVESAWAAIEALDAALDALGAVAAAVDEHLKALRFLELQGRIEAARADDTAHVRTLFDEIGRQVRTASTELREVTKLVGDGGPSAFEVRREIAALRAAAP